MRHGIVLGLAAFWLLVSGPVWASPECTCRAAGQTFQIGEQTCIRGERLAVCVMEQNVTSWQMTEASCSPVSSLKPSRPRQVAIATPRNGF